MKKDYDYAVLIGRFQPFHQGHFALYQKACQLASKVILVIGSHQRSRSLFNPWTSTERSLMIASHCRETKPTFIYIEDSAYNFPDWRRRLKSMLSKHIKNDGATQNAKLVIVGHLRDETSYYLKYFEEYEFCGLEEQAEGCSSSQIRQALFEDRLETVSSSLDDKNLEFIQQWKLSESYLLLQEEFNYVKDFKHNNLLPQSGLRSVLVCLIYRDSIVLTKRSQPPAKGLFGLPELMLDGKQETKAGLEDLFLKLGLSQQLRPEQYKHEALFDQNRRDPRGKLSSHVFSYEIEEKAQLAGSDYFWYDLQFLPEETSLFAADHAQIIQYFLNRLV